jgi:enamine deaminase RidA (YjgF/YER057c/UK114 family)
MPQQYNNFNDITNKEVTMVAVAVITHVIAIVSALLSQRVINQKRLEIRRAPGFKPWRMSKWTSYAGRLETQGLVGDPSASLMDQTSQALAKLDDILKEAGTCRSNLLHVTIWLPDIENTTAYDEMNQVYDSYLADCYAEGGRLPTRVCIGAALTGGFAVEIRASAALHGGSPF